MSVTRSDSTHHGRKRSNTAQSIIRTIPPTPVEPLQVGDTKTLTVWVHEVKDSPSIIFNRSCWPGASEGDLLHLKPSNEEDGQGILFVVPKDEPNVRPQLQVSVPKPFAESTGLRNHGEAILTKVDKATWSADYIEFTFQDQYLGRNEMWRLQKCLTGTCIHVNQEISFIGTVTAKVQGIFIGGKELAVAYVTPKTKVTYRSLSAKTTIFIQVCRELWEFASDGERYNEKIVHSFLPELFDRWKEAGTNHTVTIVLISRVFYDPNETDYAAGPLRQDEEGYWYKDFFKVITDLEVINEWKPTLVSLKDSFWDFQRDILLTHHYHRASLNTTPPPRHGPYPRTGYEDQQVRLVGRLSHAHDGPILEALNLALNPTETHYIDRSLSLTGTSTIIITPGTGYFRVNKRLLRLTTNRLLDQGFGVDLVSLDKAPCHQSPIFSFYGTEPELGSTIGSSTGPRSMDPLWGGDDTPPDNKPPILFWWEPFWMTISFWDEQMDLPFRHDRFVARAKMHEIQMLGLLEHDVISNIEVPLLPELQPVPSEGSYGSLLQDRAESANAFELSALQFDNERFAPPKHDSLMNRASFNASHSSLLSSSGSTVVPSSSYRSSLTPSTHPSRTQQARTSYISPKVPPIEESPHVIHKELPPEGNISDTVYSTSTRSGVSVASSSSSIKSNTSNGSKRTTRSSKGSIKLKRDTSTSRNSITSKLAPSWLFNPFRSLASEPQTSPISASVSTSSSPSSVLSAQPTAAALSIATSPIRMPTKATTTAQTTISHSPLSRSPNALPIAASKTPTNRSALRHVLDEEVSVRDRNATNRRSPLSTPPHSEFNSLKRRSTQLSGISFNSQSWTSPSYMRVNPSRPHAQMPEAQAILAHRWQHMFPQPLYKNKIKWMSMVYPGCLPLTTEYFPSAAEIESSYDRFSYHCVVDPKEMKSFLVRPIIPPKASPEETRKACALAVMRAMVAVRLAQGFQFVIAPSNLPGDDEQGGRRSLARTKSFALDDDFAPKPQGSADILTSTTTLGPVFLSVSNEIHQLSYVGENVDVVRYVRRTPAAQPFEYQCLIWPKLGVGYTELSTTFTSHGLENFGWNRLDMLVAGFELQFNESLRYWRTRFIVIPTAESPELSESQTDLSDEEIRILGIEKLAEQFSRLRWQHPEERGTPMPPVRFLPTTLGPSESVLDETLVAQLDEIHSTGSLKKKMKSEREIGEMSLGAIAKAMREDNGLPIKHHQWHKAQYPNSFTGYEFVSWLVREFRDVSTRAQGAEWGVKLLEQGLIEHVKEMHNFLDGHYFYRLKGEYAVQMTPRGWFRSSRSSNDDTFPRSNLVMTSRQSSSPRRNRKRLILSQSMVIDIDPSKKSDQAEAVILHHDLIHNPATVFHFELQWVGTTARCIEDQLRQWNRAIERYGLKLVEAYVTQISDIRESNPFQSCFPVRLALAPPDVPDLERRLPDNSSRAVHYFEYALLRRFDFILDIEAAELYPEQVDVVYSYRRSAFRYSQFVHRTGVAFIQVVGGKEGFLFLTNRLMGLGKKSSKDSRLAAIADDIRISLHNFCQDEAALRKFYEEEISMLRYLPEDPPPLSI